MIEKIKKQIISLEDRRETCFQMAQVFLKQRDFHGLHDMGVEIAAIERAIIEMKMVLI